MVKYGISIPVTYMLNKIKVYFILYWKEEGLDFAYIYIYMDFPGSVFQ